MRSRPPTFLGRVRFAEAIYELDAVLGTWDDGNPRLPLPFIIRTPIVVVLTSLEAL
ncbi:MAG: hypothetical protein PVSMB1_09580 [Gemmatimonadaceae bacterium]